MMAVARTNWKRLAGQAGAGGVAGAVTMAAVLLGFEGRGLALDDGSQMLALMAGVVYALTGLVVGIGVLAPNISWRLLNVESADELREEGHRLWPSAIACMLIGAFFLVLAAARGPEVAGLVDNRTAAAIAAACMAGIVALTIWARKRTDELLRTISMEASATAMQLALFGLGIWGALAHLGFVAWIAPLGLISGLAMLQLIAVFAVCGRRGMLVPREV